MDKPLKKEKSYMLLRGDCLKLMKSLKDKSVDVCITDPPYGTTACKWDSVIPFEPMWDELIRIVKPKGAICLFGSQPFSSILIMSNPDLFRHMWSWNKKHSGNFATARFKPLQVIEDIIVFSQKPVNYYPQMRKGVLRAKGGMNGVCEVNGLKRIQTVNDDYYPTCLLEFSNAHRVGDHPTQKPVALLKYLIRTYTQQTEIVLDFTMGSGTTGVACMAEGRKFIGIEKDPHYFEVAKARIRRANLEPCDIPQREVVRESDPNQSSLF